MSLDPRTRKSLCASDVHNKVARNPRAPEPKEENDGR